jgi:hypothetical protein
LATRTRTARLLAQGALAPERRYIHGWIPVIAAYGPVQVKLRGFSDLSVPVVACDASVERPAARVASWAAVHADGTAHIGWYTAEYTRPEAAELEAIRRSLESFLSPSTRLLYAGVPVQVITDSREAASTALQLGAGEWPVHQECTVSDSVHTWPFPHLSLLEAARDASTAQPFTVSLTQNPADRDRRIYGPDHPLLRAAHQLAWMTRKLALDGYPLDAADVVAMLRARIYAGASPRKVRLRHTYAQWRRVHRPPEPPAQELRSRRPLAKFTLLSGG